MSDKVKLEGEELITLQSAIRKALSLDIHNETPAENAALMKTKDLIESSHANKIHAYLLLNQDSQQENKPGLVAGLLLQGLQLWDKVPANDKRNALTVSIDAYQNVTKHQNELNLGAVKALLSEVRKGLEEWTKQDDAASKAETPAASNSSTRRNSV